MSFDDIVDRIDWRQIEEQLNQEGYAVCPGALNDKLVAELGSLFNGNDAIRKTLLEAEGLGRGERFALPPMPPDFISDLRRRFYERLAPIANRWNAALDAAFSFPNTLDELTAQRRGIAGLQAHSSGTRLRVGDYEALHQYGEQPNAFPLQLVALLSEPGKDFTGGEFVMTEQRPRMQSRPMVLPLRRGDLAVITVGQRPHKGTKGYYRVNLKHAISRVRSGERIGVELLLDDVTSK
jgi:hypothetical protein